MSYVGTAFHEFWLRCRSEDGVHPVDAPFFDFDSEKPAEDRLAADFRTSDYGPWPFDGPLDSAKVVVCYANALYDRQDILHRECIRAQRSGVEDLPHQWDWYYEPRIGSALGIPVADLRRIVSVFNICPYPSTSMPDRAVRFAAGLPSVWAAQKHLREVLIPKAQAGELFLVMARKHQLWGVIEGFACNNIAFSRNIGGHLGPTLGGKIRAWLQNHSASSLDKDKAG